jgi:transposase
MTFSASPGYSQPRWASPSNTATASPRRFACHSGSTGRFCVACASAALIAPGMGLRPTRTLERFRAVSIRYDRLAVRYEATIQVAMILDWKPRVLRHDLA